MISASAPILTEMNPRDTFILEPGVTPRHDLRRGVGLAHVGRRGPVGLGRRGLQSQPAVDVFAEEPAGSLLDRGREF